MRRLGDSSFFLVANGYAEHPPASAIRDYLAANAREVTAVFHPLTSDDGPVHRIGRWREGELVEEREVRLWSRPPLTYGLDWLVPARRSKVDGWLSFSNLGAVHGIVRRRLGLARRVGYWAVDFVPDKFGAGSSLTRVYDAVDRFAATRSDVRIELSEAARDGRTERHNLGLRAAPTHIAPIGIWLDRVERTRPDAWRERRVVFIGGLVPRQGVGTLIEAVALLPDIHLDIVGRGPLESELREQARRLGVEQRVRFVGFLPDHREVERVVASASVAAAPYATDMESFTRYADPAKIRTYVGAGLPVVLTDVPPNARELVREAGAEVVAYEPPAIADAIKRILASEQEWQRRRSAALAYAEGFDWSRIAPAALAALGFDG